MSTQRKRIPTKSEYWQFINDLAYAYYLDKSNLAQRKALYDALMQSRYTTHTDTKTGETITTPVGSYMQNLAYEITTSMIKADLGASVTELSEDILQDVLIKDDPVSGLLLGRPSALFGDVNKDIEGCFQPALGSPRVLAAFRTWFSEILYCQFIDMARAYNRQRRRELNLDALEADDEDGNGEHPILTVEQLTIIALPDEHDPLRSKKEQLDNTLANVEPMLRHVAEGVALAPWTGETDKEIQDRLGITRDKFRNRKTKALALIRPSVTSWLDEIQQKPLPSNRTKPRGSGS